MLLPDHMRTAETAVSVSYPQFGLVTGLFRIFRHHEEW
jgi:hypothetical protein